MDAVSYCGFVKKDLILQKKRHKKEERLRNKINEIKKKSRRLIKQERNSKKKGRYNKRLSYSYGPTNLTLPLQDKVPFAPLS